MIPRIKTFESDWLSSRPIFYHQKTGKVSNNIQDVIDYDVFDFHAEGLRNYMEFGYSVFEQTPVKDVKYLCHSSKLMKFADKSIKIEHQEDIAEKWIGKKSSEDEVLQTIEKSVQEWEGRIEGDIIIPTSGGYDSRLLNCFIRDKRRIRSFSYGISKKQEQSSESVYAQKLAQILCTNWERIELGDYHRYMDPWDRLFGASIHAHGMYQIEFYNKISQKVQHGSPLLSGIVGDAWAGSAKFMRVHCTDDLSKLGYSHGMHADPDQVLMKSGNELKETFWEQHREKLNDPIYQILCLVRFKIILLSYLLRVPEVFGFRAWSPFLSPEIALGMLFISPERRRGRIWQKDFFRKQGLDIENFNLSTDTSNTLNYMAIHKTPPIPLRANILREIIKPDYVDWINRKLSGFVKSQQTPETLWKNDNGVLKAYCAYLTLKPLENLIIRRDGYLNRAGELKRLDHFGASHKRLYPTKPRSGINHYDEKYFQWQKEIGKFGGIANKFKFVNFVKLSDTVIDFGCGGGYLLKNLKCKRRIGIEANPAAIDEARSNQIEVYANSENLPDGIADVLISNHALEHVENPIQQLRILRRKLANHGIVVFVVPYQDISEEYEENDKNYHLFSWNRQTLGNLFKHAGFDGIKIDLIQHQWPPNFKEEYQQNGEKAFHQKCSIYAKFNQNYQIRIVAYKNKQLCKATTGRKNLPMKELPVVLMTYNRPEHTKKVLDALRAKGQTNLFIFSDAPRTELDHSKVRDTRRLIKKIDWTEPVVIERDVNLGLARSIVSAANTVFESHDQLILLEDDCVPQDHFFDYMHTCLTKYEYSEKVFGISGHTVEVPEQLLARYPYDIYFSPRIGSWGWGTWKRAWKLFEYNLGTAYQKAMNNHIDLNQGGTDIPVMIRSMLQGTLKDVWTLNWVLTVYINRGYYIYPTRSHIKNIGTDGSGVHSGVTGKFDSPIATKAAIRLPEKIRIDATILKNFRRFFDFS